MPEPAGLLFVAEDANGDPCVWLDGDNPNGPDALLRPIDLPAVGREQLWTHIIEGLPMESRRA